MGFVTSCVNSASTDRTLITKDIPETASTPTTTKEPESMKSVPKDIRKIIDSDTSVLAEMAVKKQAGELVAAESEKFSPNASLTLNETDSKEVAKLLVLEVENGSSPANCYIPSHRLVFDTNGSKVTFELCFACRRFKAWKSGTEYHGSLLRPEEPKSTVTPLEELLNSRLIKEFEQNRKNHKNT